MKQMTLNIVNSEEFVSVLKNQTKDDPINILNRNRTILIRPKTEELYVLDLESSQVVIDALQLIDTSYQ
jgi:hypothetical protein